MGIRLSLVIPNTGFLWGKHRRLFENGTRFFSAWFSDRQTDKKPVASKYNCPCFSLKKEHDRNLTNSEKVESNKSLVSVHDYSSSLQTTSQTLLKHFFPHTYIPHTSKPILTVNIQNSDTQATKFAPYVVIHIAVLSPGFVRIAIFGEVLTKYGPATEFVASFVIGAHKLPHSGRWIFAAILPTAKGDSARHEPASSRELVPYCLRENSAISNIVVPNVGVTSTEGLVGCPGRRVWRSSVSWSTFKSHFG